MNEDLDTVVVEPHTPGPWGLEVTKDAIWIGPLRRDRLGKVAKIVCVLDLTDKDPIVVSEKMANARHIIHCVNSMETI